jgi:DUF1680 family protein
MRKIDLFPRISAALLSIVLVTLVAADKNGSSPNFGEVRREAAISFAKPVPFTAVKVTDGFWAPRIETNRAVTIPAIFKKCEETGRIDNFAVAGGLLKGEYKGERYNDTDVYKTIEGASYSLMVHPDPELDRYLDGVIAKIAAAQEPAGYLRFVHLYK